MHIANELNVEMHLLLMFGGKKKESKMARING